MTTNQQVLSDERLCEALTTAYGSPEWTMDDVRAARAIESATLAALAQQAQEPVAWISQKDLDRLKVATVVRPLVSTFKPLNDGEVPLYTCPKQAKQPNEPWGWAIVDKRGITQFTRPRVREFYGAVQISEPFSDEDRTEADKESSGIAPHAVVTLYTTPQPQPAPPVPAPVDERHRAVALELDRLMLVIESAVRWQDPTHHPAVLSLLKANRTALQSPAPQATKGQP